MFVRACISYLPQIAWLLPGHAKAVGVQLMPKYWNSPNIYEYFAGFDNMQPQFAGELCLRSTQKLSAILQFK